MLRHWRRLVTDGFYNLVTRDEVFMIFAYAKNERENLTLEQTRKLRQLVEDHLNP